MYRIDIASLRGYQAKRGLTNTAFAEELGISRNTLAEYYRQPEKMSYDVITKMVGVLEMSIEEARRTFFAEKLS